MLIITKFIENGGFYYENFIVLFQSRKNGKNFGCFGDTNNCVWFCNIPWLILLSVMLQIHSVSRSYCLSVVCFLVLYRQRLVQLEITEDQHCE